MSSSSQVAETWIGGFCSHVGHEYFAEVSEDFIEDDFNLTGLQTQVPMYKEALEVILDVEPEDEDSPEDEFDDEDDDEASGSTDTSMRETRRSAHERRHMRLSEHASIVESSADLLYGLIHQRYITSRAGMHQMQEKYDMGHFGTCPRVYCRGARVLPIGCSDIPGQETVKLFCPACLDVYAPPNSRFQNVDGAFFGTTFGCLFFMTFPELDVGGTKVAESGFVLSDSRSSNVTSSPAPSQTPAPQPVSTTARSKSVTVINGVKAANFAPGLSDTALYEPRIYGFRVSEMAKTGPRMKWLRRKPSNLADLDEVALMTQANKVVTESEPESESNDTLMESASTNTESQSQSQSQLDNAEKVDDMDSQATPAPPMTSAPVEGQAGMDAGTEQRRKKGRQKSLGVAEGGATVA